VVKEQQDTVNRQQQVNNEQLEAVKEQQEINRQLMQELAALKAEVKRLGDPVRMGGWPGWPTEPGKNCGNGGGIEKRIE